MCIFNKASLNCLNHVFKRDGAEAVHPPFVSPSKEAKQCYAFPHAGYNMLYPSMIDKICHAHKNNKWGIMPIFDHFIPNVA